MASFNGSPKHIHKYMKIQIWIHKYIYIYIYTYRCIYIYIHIFQRYTYSSAGTSHMASFNGSPKHIHEYMKIHIWIHKYICIFMFINIDIYTYIFEWYTYIVRLERATWHPLMAHLNMYMNDYACIQYIYPYI
jgi:hypothetical protein